MASTQQTIRGHLQSATEAASIVAHSRDTESLKPKVSNRHQLLEVTQVLQTTLEIDKLLPLFSREAKTFVAHSGLQFHHEKHGIEVNCGHKANHSCEYRLVIGNEHLGILTFTRRNQFNEQEVNRLENLICVLLYPLRNALRFHHAVESSFTDPLTGTNNRAAMNRSLRREIDIALRHDTPLSMIMIDIDHFKSINDTYGHSAGDCVLKSLTDCIENCIRSTDMLFRYGGEEFVVLLNNTGTKGAKLLAERIRKAVESTPSECDEGLVNLTISSGATQLHAKDDSQSFFNRADEALYQAKNSGRNRTKVLSR